MKKKLALLHIREDLLQTDRPAFSQKPARPGRKHPESTVVNQPISVQIAQLKEYLVKELKIDAIELDNWCCSIPRQADIPKVLFSACAR